MRLIAAELFLCFIHMPLEASIVSSNSQKYDTCDIVSVKPLNTWAFFYQICDTLSQLQYVATTNHCTYYYWGDANISLTNNSWFHK